MEHKRTISGIDHLGLNVPNIDEATEFLKVAFGAKVIYESYSKEQPPLEATDDLAMALNLKPKATLYACRMIQMGNGANIELFEIHVDGQRQPIKSSDLGLQHFAVYTDDLPEAIAQFELAGGTMLSAPMPLLFPLEAGEKNQFCYGATPWGTVIEFITYPDGMPYEEQTDIQRWKDGTS